MTQQSNHEDETIISLSIVGPYDFALSLHAMRSFQPVLSGTSDRLRLATKIVGNPTLIEVSRSNEQKGYLRVSSVPKADNGFLRTIVEWVLFAELDLVPFYRLASRDPKLAAIIQKLHGLKPMRPVSLFEMAVIAITEQQISLAAAYKIRTRIIQRFGESIDNQWIFPEPHILASVPLEDLRSCGLSRQKAEYIQEMADKVVRGTLDFEMLKSMDDEKARETIMSLRGFGRWSADYILVRGLARPDCVPIDDLAIRRVVGEYLADNQRITSLEVVQRLEPFRPYRGLVAFYLLAEHRLNSIGGTYLYPRNRNGP
jgi:DNA-3-methyladenine glycosylase II